MGMTVDAVAGPAPAEPVDDPATDQPALPSLSPSRAADFKTCPLLFRFRTIDRLPEQPSADQARGTLVHAVLERLFDLPAVDRTPQQAAELVAPQWERLVEEQPELAGLFPEVEGTLFPAADGTAATEAAPDAQGEPSGPEPAQTGPEAMHGGPTAAPAGTTPAAPAATTARAAGLTPAAFLTSASELLSGYF